MYSLENIFFSYIGFIYKNFNVFPLEDGVRLNKPIVLKYDGLANGKGVMVCDTTNDIFNFIKRVYADEEFAKI